VREIQTPAGLSVRVAERNDLATIASFDISEYRAGTVGLAGLQGWFESYSRGAFVLEHRAGNEPKRIVGAFGLWPITADAYQNLINGTLDEIDIGATDICPVQEHARHKYWYLADIIIEPDFRQRGLRGKPALLLMYEGLRQSETFGAFDTGIELCAIAAGDTGRALLKHLQFDEARSPQGVPVRCPNGDRVYRRSMSPADRAALLDRLAFLLRDPGKRASAR
jgi:hypothetical protein